MSRGNRIRLCEAQLKTNNQSTFSSPRNLNCRKGAGLLQPGKALFDQPAAAQADGIARLFEGWKLASLVVLRMVEHDGFGVLARLERGDPTVGVQLQSRALPPRGVLLLCNPGPGGFECVDERPCAIVVGDYRQIGRWTTQSFVSVRKLA